MSKLLKAMAIAALLASGSTLVMAQAQNPTGDPRPLTPGGADNPSVRDQKSAPTNPTEKAPAATPNVGSRPIGPPVNNTEGTPDATKDKKEQKKSPN